MGHTIPPKRQIIYQKLNELQTFSKTLREPYRSNLQTHIESVYENISSIVYTNSLDDDEMMIYAMLTRLKDKEKIRRCLAIILSS